MTETNFLTRERIEAAAKCAEGYIKHYKGALIDLKQKHEEDWAMWLEGEYEADLNYIENGIENFETLLALANAELERQSVTDEDVAEAIEMFQENIGNNNACIAILTLDLPGTVKQPDDDTDDEVAICEQENKCFRLAIQALQAYRPVGLPILP